MTSQPEMTFEIVEQKRRAFSRAIKEFHNTGGRYHNPASELPPSKVEGCEVLINRLALIDKVKKGGVIAEIGVDRGDFSLELLTRCEPLKLHLFDIDIERLVNPTILEELESGENRVKTHVGDSGLNMSRMPDNYFDVIYIDADHRYDGVKRDIEASVPKLKSDGVLIFNDYAVWSPASMYHCGVARAVHEFCLNNPWKFRYLALQPMMYNDVMLVRE
ncbi:class I SAM-dependent methyltransferase [Erythrobacter rubeus]|uniref:Class I SAM-dependent methyltransferase n=1 Tax=Erythrobacter rubeus TaxID=2760803 RepID=A0ABR8KPV1_9SPHN|nr:class I SAM-dependent methyltransferase [Erythrobacter rubeus]MBD2841038.1 class I SAM-dependent methyltransferase [Erythrobacter rubeus]